MAASSPFWTRDGVSRPSHRPVFNRRTSASSNGLRGALRHVFSTLHIAVSRLQTSFDPHITLSRLRAHSWSYKDLIYLLHLALWIFWVSIMREPRFPLNLGIPLLYLTAISSFFPAMPILTWVLTFFSSRFIPVEYRPPISVSLLPTLESILYGANISDILTRFTHPVLDVPAWLSYGVVHFVGPFVLAAFLWLFAAKGALKFYCNAFGYMMLLGVICQILFPCAAPWYELRNGLTPADYSMSGSPGGLARIDAIFHSNGYTVAFSNAPVANATIAALFISHFWPRLRHYAWGYSAILYWATMYLTHHYLIDVVGGACLATAMFYLMMPTQSCPPPFIPFPSSPRSAVPFLQKGGGRNHRHTASIASLIRSDERIEDGWGPAGHRGLIAPQPQSLTTGNGLGREGSEPGETLSSGNSGSNALSISPSLEGRGHTARARSPSWPDRRGAV
ncbi:hypothetical protein BS47DRAFT_1353286 [Hydnum rufescens UP504]|uniref:Inositolphosphotransferase Aur1/Ipt1 domain-containing protein n=1 Tax=Hydnum rufescens UP504 TaxID=1448309 RepID=A0A9P6AHQ5_9AGAM|nr:hypothetical protein BS47DRAFT_1353286 [Hydnum rufescens UP504]